MFLLSSYGFIWHNRFEERESSLARLDKQKYSEKSGDENKKFDN